MPRALEEWLGALGALDQAVSYRLERHGATEYLLHFSMDVTHAHLTVSTLQDSQHGATDRPKLSASVRPASLGFGSTNGFAQILRRETLE